MKNTILLILIVLNQTMIFAQKKADIEPRSKEEKCKYPKEEMQGKTQKEQLQILKPYLECKKQEKEAATSNKPDKEGDIEKRRKERQRQEANRQRQEQQRLEREQNRNSQPTSSHQRNDPEKAAAQKAREERQREARERANEERRLKRERDANRNPN